MSSRDEYVAQIKSAFITLGKQAAMQFLLSNVPFLGFKFVKPFTNWLVGMVIEGIVTRGETQAFFLYIDMRVGGQGKDFEDAAYANFIAQQSGSAEEKRLAEENLKKKFKEFVVLTN